MKFIKYKMGTIIADIVQFFFSTLSAVDILFGWLLKKPNITYGMHKIN